MATESASGRPADPTASSVSAATPEAAEIPAKTREELQQQLDRMLENTDTSLQFRVDEEAKRIVVSVLDGAGEVILQIPDEAALTLARRLTSTGSLLDLKA